MGWTITLPWVRAGGQTINFQGLIYFSTNNTGNLIVKGDTWNPIVNLSSDLAIDKSGDGGTTINMGSNIWTATASVDLRNGSINAGTSTLKLNSTALFRNIYTNNQTLNNVDFDGVGGGWTLQDNITTAGYFKVTNGTLNVTNRILNIGGDFNRAGGTFTTTGSTVNLNGAGASLIHGSTIFNNLTINSTNSGGGRMVTIDGSSTQTVGGNLALTGAAGKILILASSDLNNWTINPTAVTSSTYLSVSRSTNTGVAFCADHSNGSNNVGWQISNGATCTAPAAPTGFSGTADSTIQITWNWTDNADNENKYVVHNGGHGDISGDLSINTQTYSEGGLAANTQYTRHAAAINDFGTTDSNQVSKYTLADDPGLVAANVLSSSSIKLDWLSGGAQSKFNIYRDGESGVGLLVHSANDLTFTDAGLDPSSTHTYYLYAVNGDDVETTNFSTATATTQAGGGGSSGSKTKVSPSLVPSAGPTPAPTNQETEAPHIPTVIVVDKPVNFRWGGLHFDFSWLKLPDIHIPTINLPQISFTMPEVQLPKLTLPVIGWTQLNLFAMLMPQTTDVNDYVFIVQRLDITNWQIPRIAWKLPKISFTLPDIHFPTIRMPHIPTNIALHWPRNLPQFSWDFGDGMTAFENFTSHTYTRVGEYIAKLKVTADNGTQEEVVKKVTVVPPAPEITSVRAQDANLMIEGKAYPKSWVYLTVSSDPITVQTQADNKGFFKYLFHDPEQVLEQGGHEVKAYAAVKTDEGKQIKGLDSKNYNFFVDYQSQMLVVKKQAEIWKWVALTTITILILIILYGLYWRRMFGLPDWRRIEKAKSK